MNSTSTGNDTRGTSGDAATIVAVFLLLLGIAGGIGGVLWFRNAKAHQVALEARDQAAEAELRANLAKQIAARELSFPSPEAQSGSEKKQALAAAPSEAPAAETTKVTANSSRKESLGGAWRKHVVYEGFANATTVAADFTGDGLVDVISNGDGKTWLFVAPDWKPIILDATAGRDCIHSEAFDVDGDGDVDFIGAGYSPGHIFWLERPSEPLGQAWRYHLIDDQVDGVHGVLAGDVDGDGGVDLLANSAQPKGPFKESLAWYSVPANPRDAASWDRHIFAAGDAPGLSHYLGLGDVNGDGRADAASAAKGGPTASPGSGDWFAWWQAPADPKGDWTKHIIATGQLGATNIHPADVDADGQVDFIASRGHGVGVCWFKAPDWRLMPIDDSLTGPHCLVARDFDQDGDIDAATCAKDDRLAAWFENDGQGAFKTHILGRDQSAYDIRAVDLDGDADADLLIAGQDSKNIVWFENPLKGASVLPRRSSGG